MFKFQWEGKTYSTDLDRVRKTGIVSLPDGRYLIVSGWLESNPPSPAGFEVLVPALCAFAVECL